MLIHAGCLISAIHQLALSWGLIDIVHADERGPQLWHLNKEGLLSVPGYWASPCLALVSADICTHSCRLRTQPHMRPECPAGEMVPAHLCCLLHAATLCNAILHSGFLAAHLHGLSCGSPREMLKGQRKLASDSGSPQASLH